MESRVYIEIEQDFLMDTILMMEEKCSKLIDKAVRMSCLLRQKDGNTWG